MNIQYNINIYLPVLLLTLTSAAFSQKQPSPADYVNPYIGTGGHGHTFIGASVPFGAVQAGPENSVQGWDWCSGYHYSDSIVIGFSQTHLSGTAIADLADILAIPYAGPVKTAPGGEANPDKVVASHY